MPKNDERGMILIPENAEAFRETVPTCVENVDTVKRLSPSTTVLGQTVVTTSQPNNGMIWKSE